MLNVARILLAALPLVAAAPVNAEEAAKPQEPAFAVRACLTQKQRHAAIESGEVVKLATAMHVAKAKMPGTVVRARLCHGHKYGHEGLVYVLTVLAHDGKVARLTVDAVKGTLVGGL
jgi:uncharacterized membrane protein YkoI